MVDDGLARHPMRRKASLATTGAIDQVDIRRERISAEMEWTSGKCGG